MSHGLLAVLALTAVTASRHRLISYMWGHTDFVMLNRHPDIVSACKATLINQSGRCALGWLTAGILNLPVNPHLLHSIVD